MSQSRPSRMPNLFRRRRASSVASSDAGQLQAQNDYEPQFTQGPALSAQNLALATQASSAAPVHGGRVHHWVDSVPDARSETPSYWDGAALPAAPRRRSLDSLVNRNVPMNSQVSFADGPIRRRSLDSELNPNGAMNRQASSANGPFRRRRTFDSELNPTGIRQVTFANVAP